MQDHIKITNTPPRVQYIGDGTQREFFYPFPIFKAEDIEVYLCAGGSPLPAPPTFSPGAPSAHG